jgi:DNA-binding CsgD family transcriptional regulator
MRVKLCEKCPYTPPDLSDHYEAEATLHLCARCDSDPATCKKHRGLAELGERFSTLTSRERQIMDLLSERNKLNEIAARLGISVHTVRVHRSRIMSKMDAQSVSNLMLLSYKLGILGEASQLAVPRHHKQITIDISPATPAS